MIKALQSRANKKAIISNLDGYESEIIDNMVRLIKINTKCKDDTGFEFTNTYARIKLRDSELPKFNIANSYKYYLDKLNSTLYCYCESLKDEIKGEN
jgi:hypothetical protein